jgi:hypothetical protein
MFERTLSLCRRLLGNRRQVDDAGATAVHDDRRLWVRYEADVQTSVHLAQANGSERIAARVRDVSVGGARLVVDRPLQLGQILSLELPGEREVQKVLAYVVRVIKLAEARWSLGCTFSRELSPADLERFAARPARLRQRDQRDQRASERHPCTLSASYQRIGEGESPVGTARVLNISASGIGLVLTEAVEAGSLLNLNLHNSQGALVHTILGCVVHSTVRASGEVVIGCNFIRELGETELRALL